MVFVLSSTPNHPPLKYKHLTQKKWPNLLHFSCSPIFADHIYRTKLVCISKSTMKHLQKSVWILDLPWFSYGYQKCMVVDFWIRYIRSSHMCSLLNVEWLLIYEDVVQSLLNMCVYDVWSLIITESHTNQLEGLI